MIISKIAVSNFFAICSNMLTFHKHTPFHKLGIKPVNIKVGITAGVNTVRQERVELTLVSHSNFPRNGSKSLENTTVFPA